MAVAGNVRTFFIAGHLASPVTRAAKHSVEFAADQLFDERRARARTADSIGSSQLSKTSTAILAASSEESGSVVWLIMASLQSDASTSDEFEVDHPGDYATLNSYQLRDGTTHKLETHSDGFFSSQTFGMK